MTRADDSELAITVRPGTTEDAEAIHAALVGISLVVGQVERLKCSPDDIRRYGFGPQPAFETLIAEIGGEIAGVCLYFPIFSTWMGRPGVFVQDLFVAQQYRNHRIGERLMRETAIRCSNKGGVYLQLAVDHLNAKALRFYDRLGVRHTPDDLLHTAKGEDFAKLCQPIGEAP